MGFLTQLDVVSVYSAPLSRIKLDRVEARVGSISDCTKKGG